jgi:hypothetical protein
MLNYQRVPTLCYPKARLFKQTRQAARDDDAPAVTQLHGLRRAHVCVLIPIPYWESKQDGYNMWLNYG